NLVVVEPAFAQSKELDHVGAAEAHGVRHLALAFSLIQGDLHESHVLVAVGRGRKTETRNALDNGFCLDFLSVRAAQDLDNGTGDLAVGGGGEKAQGGQAFLNT